MPPQHSFIVVVLVFIILLCITVLGIAKSRECFWQDGGNISTNFTGVGVLKTDDGTIQMSNGVVNAQNVSSGNITAPVVTTTDVAANNIKSNGTVSASRLDVDTVCLQGKCVDTGKLLDVLQLANNTSDNISIVHPNGFAWKYDSRNDVLRLKTGDTIYVNVHNVPEVYNNAANRIALRNVNTGTFVRHSGYVLRCNPFAANNFDFAWFFMENSDGTFKIYNDFGGGFYVGYDNNSDVVLIVPPNDPRIVSWKTIPKMKIPTKPKDSSIFSSYTTDYNLIKSGARYDGCVDISGVSTAAGASTWLWACHGGGNQRFRQDEKQRIVVRHSGLCLSPMNGMTENNTPIGQFQCHDGAAQKWYYDANNRIVSVAAPTRCMTLSGGSTNNGTLLTLSDCSTDMTQKFF